MSYRFSDRINNTKKSFIREILKAANNPNTISFAGGLPNPISFPVEQIKLATAKVLDADGENVLQYSTTEGYLPLRQFIAKRYETRHGITVDPDEILITNGSQQALDLIGKVFINEGDSILIERPGYLGAIQAFSMFEPNYIDVPLKDGGLDISILKDALTKQQPKFLYTVPNFQNPSGQTYTSQSRIEIANTIKDTDLIFVEDDPYGELRFMGEHQPSMKTYLFDQCIMLGSFSKVVSPAMRMGWVVANPEIMDKLITAKQASDLHSNYFTQRVLYQYLADNDIDMHIEKIKMLYKEQRNCMVENIEKYFPKSVSIIKPEGGMFLWVTLPDGISSVELFELAQKQNVVFVPGEPFYANKAVLNTFRLNYTNSSIEDIETGIKRLGKLIHKMKLS